MPAEVFFDTTILIYSIAEDDPRSAIAERLLAEGGAISVQVLNEFAAVARRKLRMDWEQIEETLSIIRSLCDAPGPVTLTTHESALRIAKRYKFQIYDALILAAAIESGCTTLYSEDMQHGQRIGSIRILNPFLSE